MDLIDIFRAFHLSVKRSDLLIYAATGMTHKCIKLSEKNALHYDPISYIPYDSIYMTLFGQNRSLFGRGERCDTGFWRVINLFYTLTVVLVT